jgi:hypothetical protein
LTLHVTVRPSATWGDAAARSEILANPAFGKVFTDHTVSVSWTSAAGWHDGRLAAYEPVRIDPRRNRDRCRRTGRVTTKLPNVLMDQQYGRRPNTRGWMRKLVAPSSLAERSREQQFTGPSFLPPATRERHPFV